MVKYFGGSPLALVAAAALLSAGNTTTHTSTEPPPGEKAIDELRNMPRRTNMLVKVDGVWSGAFLKKVTKKNRICVYWLNGAQEILPAGTEWKFIK